MFKYTTSDGFTFSCSVPISGGQAQIDMLGKLFRDATDDSDEEKRHEQDN